MLCPSVLGGWPVKSTWGAMLFSTSLSWLCLLGPSVTERAGLKSLTITVNLSFSSSYSISFCFVYFEALLFDIYVHLGLLCPLGELIIFNSCNVLPYPVIFPVLKPTLFDILLTSVHLCPLIFNLPIVLYFTLVSCWPHRDWSCLFYLLWYSYFKKNYLFKKFFIVFFHYHLSLLISHF